MSNQEAGDIETGAPAPTVAGEVNLPPEPEIKGVLKPVPDYTPIEMAAGGLGAVAVATSLASIITSGFATLILIAGIAASGLGIYGFSQQTQLTDIRTLKETSAKVKEEVQRLEMENKRLKASVDELGNTAEELKDVERCLDTITKTQGQSVDALKGQLEENKKILGMMHKNMKGAIIQNLTSIIFRGDEDADGIISDEEATEVINSMEALVDLNFHEDRLRKYLVGQHIEKLIEMIGHLINGDQPASERIFELDLVDQAEEEKDEEEG